MKIIRYIFVLGLIITFQNIISVAQEWKQIIPLVSTCEDVKKILKIDKCEYPFTTVKTSSYNLMIDFSEKDCACKYDIDEKHWNVPKGTVLFVSVGLNETIALIDFASDLSSYETKEESDLPDYLRYVSNEKGIELTVFNKTTIQDVRLFPSTENSKKFKCH